MTKLSDHYFDTIGFLLKNGDGGYDIDECLSPSLTWQ